MNWTDYPYKQELGPILMAPCFSKNGYYGCCWIISQPDGFTVEAGSNDTGNMWKSPDTVFETIEEAKAKAEELWRPT